MRRGFHWGEVPPTNVRERWPAGSGSALRVYVRPRSQPSRHSGTSARCPGDQRGLPAVGDWDYRRRLRGDGPRSSTSPDDDRAAAVAAWKNESRPRHSVHRPTRMTAMSWTA